MSLKQRWLQPRKFPYINIPKHTPPNTGRFNSGTGIVPLLIIFMKTSKFQRTVFRLDFDCFYRNRPSIFHSAFHYNAH